MSIHSPHAEGVALDLKGTLHSLGIPVLDPVMVEEHMARELASAPRGTWLGRLLDRAGVSARSAEIALNRALDVMAIGGLLITVVSAVAAIMFGVATWLGPSLWIEPTSGFTIALISLAIGIATFGGAVLLENFLVRVAIYPAKWVTIEWNRAFPAIPTGVWDRAYDTMRIGIQLEVAELRQDEVILDPVLFAFDPKTGERHAIAIWKDGEVIA